MITKWLIDINYLKDYNTKRISVAVCTDLSGKEPYRLVSMGKAIASANLDILLVTYLVFWLSRYISCYLESLLVTSMVYWLPT